MVCPKCKGTKFKPLQNHEDDFLTCWNCGTLAPVGQIQIMEYSPKEEAKVKAQYDPRSKTAVYGVCTKFIHSILSQRDEGSSWDTITNLLCKATGVKLNPNSVQKYTAIAIHTLSIPNGINRMQRRALNVS